jgi:hypothetical protein
VVTSWLIVATMALFKKMLPHIPVVYEHVPDSDSVLGRYAIFRHRHLQLCSAPPLFEFE